MLRELEIEYQNQEPGPGSEANQQIRRARQIVVFTGSTIILAITSFTSVWIGAHGLGQLLGVGAIWLVLMLAFDIAFGRLVFRAPWGELWRTSTCAGVVCWASAC